MLFKNYLNVYCGVFANRKYQFWKHKVLPYGYSREQCFQECFCSNMYGWISLFGVTAALCSPSHQEV